MVVRNRCPASGDEEFLVSASNSPADTRADWTRGRRPLAPEFAARGGIALRRGGGAGRRVHLHGALGQDDHRASWGHSIVQDAQDPKDTHKVQKAAASLYI